MSFGSSSQSSHNGSMGEEISSQGSQFSILRRSQTFDPTSVAPSPRQRLRRINLVDIAANHLVYQSAEEVRGNQETSNSFVPLSTLLCNTESGSQNYKAISSQSSLSIYPVQFSLFDKQRQGCFFTEQNLSINWFDSNIPRCLETVDEGVHVIASVSFHKSHSRYLLYRLSVCQSARNRREILDVLLSRLSRSYANFPVTCEDVFTILVNFGASILELRPQDLDYQVNLLANVGVRKNIAERDVQENLANFSFENLQAVLQVLDQFFSSEGSKCLTHSERICLWHVLLLVGCDSRVGLSPHLKEQVTACLSSLLESFSEQEWERRNRELVESLALANPRSKLPIGLQSWLCSLYPLTPRGLAIRKTDAFCYIQDLMGRETVLCTGNVTVTDLREAFEEWDLGPDPECKIMWTTLSLLRVCLANSSELVSVQEKGDLDKIEAKLSALYRSLGNLEDHFVIKSEITGIKSLIDMHRDRSYFLPRAIARFLKILTGNSL